MSNFSAPGSVRDDAPRPAATVVLLREAEGGFEVFFVKRHSKSGFMAGAHVFPGGKVDASDLPDRFGIGEDRVRSLAERLDPSLPPAIATGLYLAAVREVFEESGLLLARSETDAGWALQVDLQNARARIAAGEGDLATLLSSTRLTADLEALRPWAHWVTPSAEARRFDTRFFVARAPNDQAPLFDGTETVEQIWLTPRAALEAHEARRILLPPPTWLILEELSGFVSIDAVLGVASSRRIETVLPKVVSDEGAIVIMMPWDPDYGAAPGEARAIDLLPEPSVIRRVVLRDGLWSATRGST